MGTLMMVLWWKSTALATSAHYWMVAPGSTPSISTASIASRALSHTSLYRLLRQHRCWLSHVHHMDNSHIPKDSLYSHLALCKNSKLHIAIVPAHMPALKTIFCQLFKVNEDISPMFPSKASWQWKLVSLPFFCISYDQALPTRGTTLGLWFGDCFGHTIIDKIQAVSSLS